MMGLIDSVVDSPIGVFRTRDATEKQPAPV